MAFAWQLASELSVAAIVGSVDLEYQAKTPTTSCILLIPSFERVGELSSGVGFFTFDP